MIDKDNKHNFIAPFRSITSIAISTYVVIFVVGVLSENKPEYIFPKGVLLVLLSFPGFCLGLIQSIVLSQHTSKKIKPLAWVIITTASSALACGLLVYFFKMILTNDTYQNLFGVPDSKVLAILKGIFLSLLFGCIIGSVVGLTQGLFAQRRIELRRWMLTTILYWCVGFSFPIVFIYYYLSGLFSGFK